jgi:hypothetical protein
MKVVVLQSNYIPWKGYFDLMKSADLFVVYDSVQYTKNDWRNRNLIKGPNSNVWLTIPVVTAGRLNQRIDEATVADGHWARKHWMTIIQALGKRPHFEQYRNDWEQWYAEAGDLKSLHDINLLFLRGMAHQLSISTPIVNSSEFNSINDTYSSSATERLVDLCRAVGTTTYISGPAGLNYLELDKFRDAGISVALINYNDYPNYPQLNTPFLHQVSALDLLANVGDKASEHLKSCTSLVYR